MKSLDALLDWCAAGKEAAEARGRRELHEARLRALPREEIFLYVKPIDNTRVRCLEARHELASSAAASLVTLALVIGLIAALAPSSVVLLCSHRIEELKQERDALLNRQRIAISREAELVSPPKLHEYSAEKHFIAPPPQALVFVPPAGAVASSRAGR
jgi:hypothetical protein